MTEIAVVECETAADVLRLARQAAARRRASYNAPIKVIESVQPQFVPVVRLRPLSKVGWAFPPYDGIKLGREFELRYRTASYRCADIIAAIGRAYKVDIIDLKSQRRTKHVVLPRQLAMMLCRLLTEKSFPEIGRMLGGRDHTTVLHAVYKFEQIAAVLKESVEPTAFLSSWVEKLLELCPPISAAGKPPGSYWRAKHARRKIDASTGGNRP